MRGEKQMNRKEKKAVGLLKALNNLEKKCKIEKVPYKSEIKKIMISLLPEDYGIFEILLNLIEKLQKENEEWQRAYQEEKDKQFDFINKISSNDSIPVQKVKDKIKKEIKYHEKNILDIENITMLKGKTAKEEAEIEFNKYAIVVLKKMLQELLEGRK